MTTPDPAYQPEEWVCLGVRIDSKDKRMVAWRDPAGTELYYGDRSGFVVGGIYTVAVRRDGDRTFRRKPSYTGRTLGREERLHLTVLHENARQELEALSRQRKDAARDVLGEAMEPLMAEARKLRTGSQRSAFIAEVIRRLATGW